MFHPPRFTPRLRSGAAILLALGGVCLVASACSNSPSPAAAPTTTTSSRPTPEITTPTVTIDGHTYQVPNNGGHPIDSAVDTSGEIVLTDKGFLPQREIVDLKQPITWTNLSSHPVTISFSHMPGTTPHHLPVGGTFTYSSPTLINFEYISSSGFHGTVSIGAFTP
jgi:ABC-type glycerol-3-phosphate transport system substrate-binding protein